MRGMIIENKSDNNYTNNTETIYMYREKQFVFLCWNTCDNRKQFDAFQLCDFFLYLNWMTEYTSHKKADGFKTVLSL